MIIRSTRLPNKYQEVEYIESTGTQYINAGVYPNENYRLTTKFRYTSNNMDMVWAFGTRDATSLNAFGFLINYYDRNYDVYIYRGNNSHLDYKDYRNTDIIIDYNKKAFSINNNIIYTFIVEQEFTCSYPLYLLWGNTSGSGESDRPPKGRMYYCKIYDNDILIRDFVPCYRKSDNKAGMYDTVNNVFYTNSASGADFEVGNDVKTVTDIKLNNTPIDILKIRNKIAWKRRSGDIFFLKATEDSATISTTINGTISNLPGLEYSIDEKESWNEFIVNQTAVSLIKHQKMYIRATSTNNTFSTSESNFISFTITGGKVTSGGDITSLIDKEFTNTIPSNYYFCGLFNSCTPLTTAPELPATTLTNHCYLNMFAGCTSLTSAPSELPATTLAISCYYEMFYNCASLTTAPELPATTLTNHCYDHMFSGCTSLTTAPELPATTLASSCYRAMFYNCTSLTTAPELPATTLADNCYDNMFNNCTSLTTAPELPATTLAKYCYRYMFTHCTSLTTAPELPATTLTNHCYLNMFAGCTSLTSAPSELPATTLAISCYYEMFYNCASLTTAPELPATTLTNHCYDHMFSGCTSLTTAPELPATTLASSCYRAMFYNCTSLTSAPELPATTLADNCYEDMFYNCTSLTSAPSELPATTLTNSCYQRMFYRCTSLNYIKTSQTNWGSGTTNWVTGVKSTGTFICKSALPIERGTSRIPEGWTVETF